MRCKHDNAAREKLFIGYSNDLSVMCAGAAYTH